MKNKAYLLNEIEVAELLRIAPQTLRKQRCTGIGIPFIRLGNKTVRYDPKDVMEYLDKNRKRPTKGRSSTDGRIDKTESE